MSPNSLVIAVPMQKTVLAWQTSPLGIKKRVCIQIDGLVKERGNSNALTQQNMNIILIVLEVPWDEMVFRLPYLHNKDSCTGNTKTS